MSDQTKGNFESPPTYPGTEAQPQPATNVVYVVPGRLYGQVPVRVDCSNCRASVLTDLRYETGVFTWLVAGGFVFFG